MRARMPLNFHPKLDKIVELLLHLAHVRPNADKYQAVKFFYLADREHLALHGRPITNEDYFALPYGPVASKAMDLLEGDRRTLREAGIDSLPFETEVVRVRGKDIVYLRKPHREVDRNLFSKSDIRVFDDVIEKYGDHTFEQLFEITHDHAAYKKAWTSRKYGSKRAPMHYEDMVESSEKREALLEDIAPIAAHME
jgi:uncharacterized phage-associated protein